MHPLYNLCAIFSVLISIPYAAPSPLELTKAYTSLLAKSSSGVSGVNATFDYVIVGGGTAGLTIASRLAENSLFSVVVIEAGGFYELDDGNRSVVPGYASFYAGTDPNDTQPLVDWNFVTEPQAGANSRLMHYARGRTLGGSSARNFLLYQRPTFGSCKKWAAEVGDSSYSFENLLPFYQRSVNYTPATFQYPNSSNEQDLSAFSSTGGPLHVSFGNYNDPFATWVQPALEAVGQSAINGFQSGSLIGSAYYPSTINPANAQRSSSESSFLQSVIQSTSLRVYNNTLAQRLIFRNNIAEGVAVCAQGTSDTESYEYVLSARREVIVSAGAFQSPQLLMVSGIGPRQTLESLGIPVLVDLPGVGQNLWDQPWFGTVHRVNLLTASAGLDNPALASAAVQAYLQSAVGPLTISTTGVLGFEKLPPQFRRTLSVKTREILSSTFPADWPELEFLPASGDLGYNTDYQKSDPKDDYNYATIATALVAPLSRGNVSINSTKMSDPPLINPNWLTDPADVELAIAAFKRQRQVWSQMSNLTIGEEQLPGPSVQSDADILHYIRESVSPLWHAAATCKMGNATDPMAVIDTAMRVYGVHRLRVVDASSFPFLPPGHPQSTIYAMAEKIASEILHG